MNELNKLLGSLILLGGGFLVASLVGPPEVIDQVSQYLKPTPAVDPYGLRPLPAGQAATTADGWPALNPPAQDRLAPRQAEKPVASSPASFPPPPEPITQASPSAWPPLEPGDRQPAEATAPDNDWLTRDAFDFGPAFEESPESSAKPQASSPSLAAAAAPARPLTPVARSRRQPTAPTATADAWPELRGPASSPFEDTLAQQPTQPSTEPSRPFFSNEPPSLDRSPYSDRQSIDTPPVQRTPVAVTYTKHIVTDGDTLSDIAARYLGDASRAAELFELNRDRLDNPDVLPIGMVLKTPDDRGRRRGSRPAPSAAPIDAFPPLPAGGAFSTVAATDGVRAFARDVARGLQRPITRLDAVEEPPLSASQRLGPVDPLYDREVRWDASGW